MRGWELKTRNPIVAARRLSPTAYSVARYALGLHRDLSRSVASRGFGAAEVSPKVLRLDLLDKGILLASSLAVIIVTYGVYTWGWGII